MGGMETVAREEHYQTLFEKCPANRHVLLGWSPERFMLTMRCWGESLAKAGDAQAYPVTAISKELLHSLSHPALCVFVRPDKGEDDGMHTQGALAALHACLSGAIGPPVVTSEKEVYISAIVEFVRALPRSASAAPTGETSAPLLGVRPGMYPQLPHDAEFEALGQFYHTSAERLREAPPRRGECAVS